jgi:hypothetical protein
MLTYFNLPYRSTHRFSSTEKQRYSISLVMWQS